jgi:hypothetical protein
MIVIRYERKSRIVIMLSLVILCTSSVWVSVHSLIVTYVLKGLMLHLQLWFQVLCLFLISCRLLLWSIRKVWVWASDLNLISVSALSQVLTCHSSANTWVIRSLPCRHHFWMTNVMLAYWTIQKVYADFAILKVRCSHYYFVFL